MKFFLVTGTLREDLCYFIIMSLIFLTINVSDKICSKNQNMQFIIIYLKSCLYKAVYENVALPIKPQMAVLFVAR
jgi:hypothetical protein